MTILVVVLLLYRNRSTSFDIFLKNRNIERVGITRLVPKMESTENDRNIFDDDKQNIRQIIQLLESYNLKSKSLPPYLNFNNINVITLYMNYQDNGIWYSFSIDISENGDVVIGDDSSRKYFVSLGTEQSSKSHIYNELDKLINQLYSN